MAFGCGFDCHPAAGRRFPHEAAAMPNRAPVQPLDRRKGAMERHITTLLQVIVTAGVLSLAKFAWEAQSTLQRLDERTGRFAQDISQLSDSMKTLADTSEKKADHDSDMQSLQTIQGDHEIRIRQLEQQRRRQ